MRHQAKQVRGQTDAGRFKDDEHGRRLPEVKAASSKSPPAVAAQSTNCPGRGDPNQRVVKSNDDEALDAGSLIFAVIWGVDKGAVSAAFRTQVAAAEARCASLLTVSQFQPLKSPSRRFATFLAVPTAELTPFEMPVPTLLAVDLAPSQAELTPFEIAPPMLLALSMAAPIGSDRRCHFSDFS